MKFWIGFFVVLPLFAYALANDARAQDLTKAPDVVSVKSQYDATYAPLGIKAPGLFMLYPSVAVDEFYDDNIYRTTDNEQTDFITEVDPGIKAESNWNRHKLILTASGNFGYYADNDSENYEDYHLQALGKLDIVRDTYFDGFARLDHLHEDRNSPDDVGGDEPTEMDVTTVRGGFTRELARIKLHAHYQHQELDFEDATRNGALVDNDHRNRNVDTVEGMLTYEMFPNYNVFTRATYNERKYDETGLNNRNSDGYEVVAGSAIDISGKTKGEIYGGYMQQHYDQLFDDLGSVNFGGSLLWNITGLTSVSGEVERSVQETTIRDASAFVRTDYRLAIEHALLRNLFLDGHTRYINDDYSFNAGTTSREDDYYLAGLGLEYKLRRGMTMRAGYDYTKRDSTTASQNYDGNLFMLSAHLQM